MTRGVSLAESSLPLSYGTSFGKAVPHWAIREITWAKFCQLLKKPATSKTGAMSYIPGTIVPGPGNKCKCDEFLHRTKKTVVDRWAITLDADYCGNAGSALARNLNSLEAAFAMHTTWSSTEDDERYRVIIPLSRSVGPLEYAPLANYMMSALGEGMFDSTCDQASRLMYLPARADGDDTYWLAVGEGDPLDVEFWLDIAGGPDPEPVVRDKGKAKETAMARMVDLPPAHYNQLKGLWHKVSTTEEGNRDSILLWALKAVNDCGIDPDIAGDVLIDAGIYAGLDEAVCVEKVVRVLGDG